MERVEGFYRPEEVWNIRGTTSPLLMIGDVGDHRRGCSRWAPVSTRPLKTVAPAPPPRSLHQEHRSLPVHTVAAPSGTSVFSSPTKRQQPPPSPRQEVSAMRLHVLEPRWKAMTVMLPGTKPARFYLGACAFLLTSAQQNAQKIQSCSFDKYAAASVLTHSRSRSLGQMQQERNARSVQTEDVQLLGLQLT